MSRAEPKAGEPSGDVGGAFAAGDEAALAGVPLTVAAVAARLGVAPSTLRTWDRRYGLGPSGRSAGSHRRYTPEDVARLETMRRLTLAGAAPSDAARMAAQGAPGAPSGAALARVQESLGPVRVDGLSLAAAAVDGLESRVVGMFAAAVRSLGLVGAWLEVALPAFGFLGDREPGDRPGRDPETMLANAVLSAARDVVASADVGAKARKEVPGARVALLAGSSVTDRVGAHVLAAALTQRGVVPRVFGRVPDLATLLRAVEGAESGAVCVVGSPPDGEQIAREAAERGEPAVFLVGPDSPDIWLPGVLRVRTLPGAVHEIADFLSPGESDTDEGSSGAHGDGVEDR